MVIVDGDLARSRRKSPHYKATCRYIRHVCIDIQVAALRTNVYAQTQITVFDRSALDRAFEHFVACKL